MSVAPHAHMPVLDARQSALLDSFTVELLQTADSQAHIERGLRFFVPRLAERASIALDQSGGEQTTHVRSNRPGALRSAQTVEIKFQAGGRNFGVLRLWSQGLTPETLALARAAAERLAIALWNALRFERERRVSLTFQHAAINQTLPLVPGFRFDAVYEPGSAEALIGGDWYDVFVLNDGRLVLSIGDVSGSGLDAAVTMVSVRQSIRSVAHVHADPALMLDAADHVVRTQFPERYTTTFVAVLDPVTRLMAYANAGHPPPLARTASGQIHAVSGHGLPLGVEGFETYNTVHHCSIDSGTLLLFYTDGLTEATRDVFEGEQVLRTAIARLPEGHANIARHVHDSVLRERSRDDVAVLSLIMEDSAPIVRRWRFDPMWADATHRVRDELCETLARAGMNEWQLFGVLTLFSETIANLARHAPGTAELLLEQRGDQAVLHVLDTGPGFSFAPKLPHDLFSEHGRGLFLIDRFASGFSVERRPGGGSHARIILNTRTGA